MQFRNLSKIAMVLLGFALTVMGVVNLWISSIGTFAQGRIITATAGTIFLILGLACFTFLVSRKLSKVLGAIALLAFAGAMLWLVFSMSIPTANQPIYQIAAIALPVILLARVLSGLRTKSTEAGT